MIVISDTTPLRYLIETDLVHILEALFGNVIIPQAVFAELQHAKTPLKVKNWIVSHPAWLEVRQADLSTFTPRKQIGQGELEAFALAVELNATAVLLDDRAAMVEAQRHNITTIPTFAILAQAASQNLIDLPNAVALMRQTTLRLPSEAEIEAMLERDRERKLAG